MGLLLCLLAYLIFLSPAGMRLSPKDPGILRGGMAIALWVLLVCGVLFFLIQLFRKGKGAVKHVAAPRNQQEKTRTEERFQMLSKRPGSGYIAKKALDQMESAGRKAEQFRSVIRTKFGASSLTASRYEGVLEQSLQAISENGAHIAEQLELFDDSGYEALSHAVVSGEYKTDGVDDSLQEERLTYYRQRLRELEQMLNPAEEMLLRLDRCADEVARLSNEATEAENERILEEIQNLINTTKYYKQ